MRSFYETWFIGHWPEDTKITLVSRTAGESQLVDELILSFTHDCEMPAISAGHRTNRAQSDGSHRSDRWLRSRRQDHA